MRLFSIFALLVCCGVCFEIAEGYPLEPTWRAGQWYDSQGRPLSLEAQVEAYRKGQERMKHEAALRNNKLKMDAQRMPWLGNLPDENPERAERKTLKEPVDWGVISLISLFVGTMLVTWIQGALAKSDAASTEASADDGEWGSVSGTITREAGFDKAITITLLGLPKGYTAPSIEIAGDVNEYTLPIQFPKESKPGDLKNIKLVATAASEPKVEVQVVTTTLD